jgi:hypothetical protein
MYYKFVSHQNEFAKVHDAVEQVAHWLQQLENRQHALALALVYEVRVEGQHVIHAAYFFHLLHEDVPVGLNHLPSHVVLQTQDEVEHPLPQREGRPVQWRFERGEAPGNFI